MAGHVHSIESFGTVDGPGVRLVVFFQGCPLRCLYCHNPDTWHFGGGTEMTAGEIIALYEKNRPFYKNGGITATGGEPLGQMEFLTELFEAASMRGIHTCLDTSGITFSAENASLLRQFDRLTAATSLVMLDIKHIDPDAHLQLTGKPLKPVLDFARYLDGRGVPMWIRHVIVPGITYDQGQLFRLGQFIGSLRHVKALDVLPYHDMGRAKYDRLGLDYRLKDTKPLGREEAIAAKRQILSGIQAVRSSRPQPPSAI
ncbi:MAG: pyruvate formate-lyase-activating protein [Eubacteriales bacterium]|nr:pyruvate formate-lyase-activating protein [Eubacteriales bacterium]